eukprot:951517_1
MSRIKLNVTTAHGQQAPWANKNKNKPSSTVSNKQDSLKSKKDALFDELRKIEHTKIKEVISDWKLPMDFQDILNLKLTKVPKNDGVTEQFVAGFTVSMWRYGLRNTRLDIANNMNDFVQSLSSVCGDYILKLAQYSTSITPVHFSDKKYKRLKKGGKINPTLRWQFVYNPDIICTGVSNAQELYFLIRRMVNDMERIRSNNFKHFGRFFTADFNLQFVKRFISIGEDYVYFCKNAHVAPKYSRTLNPLFDLAAIELRQKLKTIYPNNRCTVFRFERTNRLKICCDSPLDILQLNAMIPQLCWCRVYWQNNIKYSDRAKARDERNNQTNDDKIKEYKKLKLVTGNNSVDYKSLLNELDASEHKDDHDGDLYADYSEHDAMRIILGVTNTDDNTEALGIADKIIEADSYLRQVKQDHDFMSVAKVRKIQDRVKQIDFCAERRQQSECLKERRRLADAIETGHQSFLGIMSHLKPILLSSFHEEDGDDDCGDEAMGNFDDEKVTKTMNAFKKLNEQYRAMDAQLVDSENTRLTNIKCAYGVNKSMLVDIPLNDTDKQLNEDIKTSNDKLRTEQQSIMEQRSTRDEHLARLREKHLAFQDMKSNKDLSKYNVLFIRETKASASSHSTNDKHIINHA